MPSIAEIVALQNDICLAGDLREPVNLREQLVHSSGLSSEVGSAIAEMLQVKFQALHPAYVALST